MLAMAVGVLLEFLLQSLAHPLAAFGFHLEFNRAQRARSSRVRVHGPPIFGCWFRMGGKPFTTRLWGQCQVAPQCAVPAKFRLTVVAGSLSIPAALFHPEVHKGKI